MIRTVRAEQAHAVPAHSYAQRSIFDPGIYRSERPVLREDRVDEMGLPEAASGATAQNNFREVRYLRCSLCNEVMPEADTAYHTC